MAITKRCYSCKKELKLEKFYKNRSTKDGLHNHCKECKYKSDLKTSRKKQLKNLKLRNEKTKMEIEKYNLLLNNPEKLYEKMRLSSN